MQLLAIQRVLGLLLMLFSLSMLTPLLVSWGEPHQQREAFLLAFALAMTCGAILWYPVRRVRQELWTRDGFVVVALFWAALGLFGAVPFSLAPGLNLKVTDAVFESVSGLTTTGATLLTGLDRLPLSLLFYRQQLQWLGGLGLLVLAVAVLPMLGVGGMQVSRANTPGPVKDDRLAPRVVESIKHLGLLYLLLTAACALGYWLAGMSPFDAVAHSFSTISTGGFSTHDANFGHFADRPAIEAVAMLFMLLGSTSFALHYYAWHRRDPRVYLRDAEFPVYLLVLGITAAIVVAFLLASGAEHGFAALRTGLFQTVAIGTTSGFTLEPVSGWPAFVPILLVFITFIGGCTSSTAGGMKVLRFLLLLKQGLREIGRLIHPNAVIAIKVGGRPLPDRVLDAVWGYFAAYVGVFSVMLVVLMAFGMDQASAFAAVSACLNNVGPSLVGSAAHYAAIADGAKWVLVGAMLFGRMEVFILLALFTPSFWQR